MSTIAKARWQASDRPAMRVWLVDPISYSGMAYSDVGQVQALRELGCRAVLLGSDSWMLAPDLVPRVIAFRGTHGRVSKSVKGARYLRDLLGLVRRVVSARPDVVHWQFTELPVADIVAMTVIRLAGVRQVYTAHELLPWSTRRHHRWLFSLLYRVVDAVVVHSPEQRAALVGRFGTPPTKVHVAPLGDYASFATPGLPQAQARDALGLPHDDVIALFFGTIRPSKGLDILLHAWPAIASAVAGARLVIAGKPFKGLETSAIDALIRELGIEATVSTRFEQVDPLEANDYYRASDVVVLPYREIGTSGVLRYAYNSARPVVATAVGEHPSRIIEGETGWLVPPGDPESLAAALIEALADRPRLADRGEVARAYADRTMGWPAPARTLLGIYSNLVAETLSTRSRRPPVSR